MLLFNLKIAARNIWRNRVFSIVNIMGLSLSIACCISIALYIWNEIHFDDFHRNAANIFRVTEKQNQAGTLYNVAVTPGPLAPALQKDFPEIENTVRLGYWSGTLRYSHQSFEEKNIQLTENSFFSVFNFPLLKGNRKTALASPGDIVLTERTAEKYFGKEWASNPAILGQRFRLNNETDFTVAGIAKNPPANSSIQFDVLLPLLYYFQSDEWANKWDANNFHTYLQLKPGTQLSAFEKKISRQLQAYHPPTKDLVQLQPLKAQYLYSSFDFKTDWGRRSNIKYINIFAGVGILLLIIACVNFINLSTARSVKRSMEVGIRKVNGATRGQLIRQFLSESVLLAGIAGVLAIIMVSALQPALSSMAGSAIDTSLSRSMILPFLVLFVLVIGLLAGLYPAFFLSAFNPARVLKKTGSTQSGKWFRQALVVGQFTVAVTLISCTFFMYRQLRYIQQKDLGFDKTQLVSLRLGGQLKEKAALYKHELESIAGVTAAAPATMSLVDVENSAYLEWEGMKEEDKFLITQSNADPDFIPALGMQLLYGNNFSWQKAGDTASYIVNEAAVKKMGLSYDSIIGKNVRFYGAKGTIIGIVKDFHFKPMSTGIAPFILRYQPWSRYFNLFVRIAPGKTRDVLLQAEKIYKKYEATAPFEFSFVSDRLEASYKDEKRTAGFILLFANLSIFIGCLGLFGLTVFSAEQRIKEIGIRKVLGAGMLSVTGLLSKDFLQLVIIAIAIAVPAAWYSSSKWLNNYAYRINIDWWVFVWVALLVTGIAFVTISFQAIKAAMANPVKTLRTE